MKGNSILQTIANCSHCPLTKYPNNIMCSLCKVIRHPHPFLLLKSMNYFSIFSMEPKYSVDQSLLSSSYKELQKQIHPDRNLVNSQLQQSEANDCSSLVSEAYQTIKEDLTRAEYLLQINGMPLNHSSSKTDPSYLLKLYSMREKIEETKSKDELSSLKSTIELNINKSKKLLETYFNNKQFVSIHEVIKDIKYNQSMINHINTRINLI